MLSGTNIEIDVTLEPTNAAAPVGIQTIILEWTGSSAGFLPNTTFVGLRDDNPGSFLADSGGIVVTGVPVNSPRSVVAWGDLGVTRQIFPNFATTLVNP